MKDGSKLGLVSHSSSGQVPMRLSLAFLDLFTNQVPIILPSSPSLSHSVLVTSYLSVQWFVLYPFAYKS